MVKESILNYEEEDEEDIEDEEDPEDEDVPDTEDLSLGYAS